MASMLGAYGIMGNKGINLFHCSTSIARWRCALGAKLHKIFALDILALASPINFDPIGNDRCHSGSLHIDLGIFFIEIGSEELQRQ